MSANPASLLIEQHSDPDQIVDYPPSRRSRVVEATSSAVLSVAAIVRSVASAALKEAATEASAARLDASAASTEERADCSPDFTVRHPISNTAIKLSPDRTRAARVTFYKIARM